jgi:hypothetical protein
MQSELKRRLAVVREKGAKIFGFLKKRQAGSGIL